MPANRKPKAWNLRPQLTAAPGLWRDVKGLWPMWEGVGPVIDLVTRDVSQVNGTPARVATPAGQGISFNGSSDAFQTGWLGITGGVDRTFFGLIVRDPASTERTRIFEYGTDASGQKYGVRVDEDNGYGLRFEHGGGFITGGTALNDGGIHSIEVIFNGDTLADAELFVDGKKESIANSAGLGTIINTGTNSPAVIGRNVDATSNFWHGQMIMLGLAERAWSASEVKQYHDDPFAMLRPAGF